MAAAGPVPADAAANIRCRAAVDRRLAAWGAGVERYRDADGLFGARQWRMPTPEIGIWVMLHEPRSDAPSVARIDAQSITRVSFDSGCVEVSTTNATAPIGIPAADAFLDRDLRTLLAREPRGVVYVWSPHMPLSVDAYRTVSEVARRMRISFTALRDPMSDGRYAAEVVKQAGLPATALRTFSSVELAFRHLTLHAPAILVFAQGRLAGLAVPGYREAAGFEAVISERLRSTVSTSHPSPDWSVEKDR